MTYSKIPQHISLDRLNPSRALYSTTAAASEPDPEPQPPIRCDDCQGRAGAVGLLTYWCPTCRIATRVFPEYGSVELTAEQFADVLRVESLDTDRLNAQAQESAKLEPVEW